jgi:Sulfite exporter TauE/SafE.
MGTIIGFLNGFMGGGGGVVAVLILMGVYKLPPKSSHATTLLIILPITIVSALIYIIGGNVDWNYSLIASIGVFMGGIIGVLLLKNMRTAVVDTIFAILLIVGGIKMLIS